MPACRAGAHGESASWRESGTDFHRATRWEPGGSRGHEGRRLSSLIRSFPAPSSAASPCSSGWRREPAEACRSLRVLGARRCSRGVGHRSPRCARSRRLAVGGAASDGRDSPEALARERHRGYDDPDRRELVPPTRSTGCDQSQARAAPARLSVERALERSRNGLAISYRAASVHRPSRGRTIPRFMRRRRLSSCWVRASPRPSGRSSSGMAASTRGSDGRSGRCSSAGRTRTMRERRSPTRKPKQRSLSRAIRGLGRGVDMRRGRPAKPAPSRTTLG